MPRRQTIFLVETGFLGPIAQLAIALRLKKSGFLVHLRVITQYFPQKPRFCNLSKFYLKNFSYPLDTFVVQL